MSKAYALSPATTPPKFRRRRYIFSIAIRLLMSESPRAELYSEVDEMENCEDEQWLLEREQKKKVA